MDATQQWSELQIWCRSIKTIVRHFSLLHDFDLTAAWSAPYRTCESKGYWCEVCPTNHCSNISLCLCQRLGVRAGGGGGARCDVHRDGVSEVLGER